MDPRYNGRNAHHHEPQHHRFSWQTPPETPPEQNSHPQQRHQPVQHYHQQQSQQHNQHHQSPSRIHTQVEGQPHTEHIAFQYIPSPSEAPPLPQMPTPIDPRPASYYMPHQQTAQFQPPPTSASPPYQQHPDVSPLFSPISPVATPAPAQTHPHQNRSQTTQHARNLRQPSTPPVPHMPQTNPGNVALNHPIMNHPITPISPSSIKKEPLDHLPPSSPNGKASYPHQPYSPHGLSSSTNTRHAIFTPDSQHGPNGLDFSLHRPGQIAHPNMDLSSTGTKQSWKTSLCSCTPDVSTCLTGLFCPCIIYGRTSYRLTQKSEKKDPTDLLSHSATNGHCIIMAFSCGFWWLYPMLQRTRLRHMYKLEGDLVGDCVKAACCCCCVAVQNEREVKAREESARRWAGPASSEVYGREAGMKYVPQQ
ncbi:PLAC8-domain-containing protein [Periconia macrospinosa]|uniref:PLAC8-domain-containing protein n=1 Tax=Periconia macrospinosa TaxID=97972 RepID=A0A2V1DPE5_9PLEO|nr:PLAC8-domain-containing protein [Periconia macrospinosa]